MDSDRPLKVINELMSGDVGSMKEAMIRAQYSPSYADNSQRLKRQEEFQALIKQYIPDNLLVKVHLEGLGATKRTFEGDELPDYPTRHKYLDTGYKLKRAYPTEIGGLMQQNNILVLPGELIEEFNLNEIHAGASANIEG